MIVREGHPAYTLGSMAEFTLALICVAAAGRPASEIQSEA